ncbi:MAG: protein kinase [Sandaracinaceae bacterium]|nr:protein kinase [Sandaracinaceae bacterium]
MTEPARHLHVVSTSGDNPDPLVGQLVDGRYRVEGVLGAGGMGLVYRARHAVLGKPLALKVLKPEVSRDEEVMARFRREAQAASAVGSPHICDVSDFGSLDDGSTYFVMELLDGPSLTSAMQRDRPLPVARTLRIARQLCEALGAAHARGIVHRDLKPDNVHLVPRGSDPDFVKVLDFGIAKVAGGADKKLTRAGQVFGTPHYMSPEQCSGRDVDHRTDIYALGVMLYEMACGQVPFDADTLMGVLTKHVYEQPVPPHQLAAGAPVPAGLEAVILKCLAKQPADRYASMSALAADLEAVERGVTPGAVAERVEHAMTAGAPVAAPTPQPIVPAAPERRRSTLPLALAAAALAVLAAGAFAAAYLATVSDDAEVASREPEASEERAPTHEERVATSEEAREDEPATDPSGAPPPASDEPPDAPAATVRLETDPAGALVYDAAGTLIGNTPVSLPRPSGDAPAQYRIALRGHRDQVFAVSARTQASVTLHLERERRGQARVETVAPEVRPLEPDPATQTTTGATTRTTRDPDLEIDHGIINPFEDPPRRRTPSGSAP